MSKTIDEAIVELKAKIADKERELIADKKTVNTLCGVANIPPIYNIKQEQEVRNFSSFRNDEFYGQPLASCVGRILKARKDAALGAASPDELYTQLIAGGFKFESKNEGFARRSMIIALSKNTTKFHRLPNGNFGLAEWYPNAKNRSAKNNTDSNKTDSDVDDSAPETSDLEAEQG